MNGHGAFIQLVREVEKSPLPAGRGRRPRDAHAESFDISLVAGPFAERFGRPTEFDVDTYGGVRERDRDTLAGVRHVEQQVVRRKHGTTRRFVGELQRSGRQTKVLSQQCAERGARIPREVAVLLESETTPFCEFVRREQSGQDRLFDRDDIQRPDVHLACVNLELMLFESDKVMFEIYRETEYSGQYRVVYFTELQDHNKETEINHAMAGEHFYDGFIRNFRKEEAKEIIAGILGRLNGGEKLDAQEVERALGEHMAA